MTIGEEKMRVKIGPVTFTVQYIKGLRDEVGSLDGWIRHNASIITIDKSLDKQRARLVLWHEIIHAILTHGGYSNHDERMADVIASGVMNVLNENKWLRKRSDAA